MIKAIGNNSFKNFVNLNKALLENIFDPKVFNKKINLFTIDSESEIKNIKKNKNNLINEETISIYIANKRNKIYINQKHLSHIIFYPLKPNEFLNLIKSITIADLLKKYGLLAENNIVSNLQKDKKTNLTNTEIQILSLLVLGSKVERKLLEKKALNFKNEIASNSLDSHLVRLRKKIKQINKNIEIVSKESKSINIALSI